MEVRVRDLRYAATLRETLHFGQAASRHYTSAQEFSRAIQRLERDLGYQLFERTSRRVRVTERGEWFIVKASEKLNEFDDLVTWSRTHTDPWRHESPTEDHPPRPATAQPKWPKPATPAPNPIPRVHADPYEHSPTAMNDYSG